MKQSFFLICLFISCFSFAQEKLLSKKIVYSIDLTESVIKQGKNRDTLNNVYKINERFWWESIDIVMQKWKEKTLQVYNTENKVIVWDSMLSSLKLSLEDYFKKALSPTEIQNILENNITKIEFEEEWTYSPITMLINKKNLSYTPIITIDSLHLTNDGFVPKSAYQFKLGTIRQNQVKDKNNILLITRNIQYIIPIYNYEPYLWWQSNLEEEYSLPYFDSMIEKAENMEIAVFESQDKTEALQKNNVLKRRDYTSSTKVINDMEENIQIEYDTIISLKYNSEDIDHLKFGEEIYFDKTNLSFIKNTNYLAPMISIKDDKGTFLYYYPLYHIRKK